MINQDEQQEPPERVWIEWPRNPADDRWYFLKPDISNVVEYRYFDLAQPLLPDQQKITRDEALRLNRSQICSRCGHARSYQKKGQRYICKRGTPERTVCGCKCVFETADVERGEQRVIEGPSSTEYEAWLNTRADLIGRFTANTFTRNAGYEIWRNAWLKCRELATGQPSQCEDCPPAPVAKAGEPDMCAGHQTDCGLWSWPGAPCTCKPDAAPVAEAQEPKEQQ